MKISTRGRYALRMMLEFAKEPDAVTRLGEVAKSQQLSEKYLEQIISILTKAGFVKSIRGAQGGYLLARPAEKYSVGEILRLTEGSMAPVVCLEAGTPPCDLAEMCVSRNVFQKIDDAVNAVIDNISLADLLKEEEKLGPDAQNPALHRICQNTTPSHENKNQTAGAKVNS